MVFVERAELRSKSDGAGWELSTGGRRGARRQGLERNFITK